ncbi:MAG: zeta toxin family protein [Halioglobus sp.]
MISVIAGINGAGKSSIAGARIRSAGGDYFNPDEVARSLREADRTLSQTQANAQAWTMGFEQLSRAIEEELDYTFETTLGGNSICQRLHEAIDKGREVRIFFCGLASPELHMERVAARVARGGHDIPEAKIRERWIGAIHNMLGLIPRCAAVRVFDNSEPSDRGGPQPVCLFSLVGNSFDSLPVESMPEWARPLASAAIRKSLS